MIQKEITIISDCEIVSFLDNSIELRTVLDLDVNPNRSDITKIIINEVNIDKKGLRTIKTKKLSLVVLKNLKSDIKMIKHFTLSGDIAYIKSKYKVGESILLKWKTTTEVEHYIEKNKKGDIILEGFYVDGLPVDQEKSINKDGNLIVSNNSIGFYHGLTKIYNNDVKIKEINWFMGKKHGSVTEWYLNGNLKSNTFYIEGTVERLNEIFYENGKKKSKGYYLNGKKNGKWLYWDKNGKKTIENFNT